MIHFVINIVVVFFLSWGLLFELKGPRIKSLFFVLYLLIIAYGNFVILGNPRLITFEEGIQVYAAKIIEGKQILVWSSKDKFYTFKWDKDLAEKLVEKLKQNKAIDNQGTLTIDISNGKEVKLKLPKLTKD